MGDSFSLEPEVDRFVAQLGSGKLTERPRPFGMFTTSNIVQGADGFYMIAYGQGGEQLRRGNCLFRNSDPMNPHSWLAWSGQSFSADMTDGDESCQPLKGLPSQVRSLSFVTKSRTWVAVMATRRKLAGDTEPIRGFYYATSKNLIDWSPLTRIIAAPLKAREENMTHVWAYPSLLDPSSKSRNFDTVDGDEAVLLFTVHHLRQGRGTMNRDLQYLPVRVD
ncbi:MAG: hypothetical protein DI629_12030 [Mesorhizobium amorphae]|nr:MAG: hypothetical protein DI629_12030 [Mesorhizobium amorphae]